MRRVHSLRVALVAAVMVVAVSAGAMAVELTMFFNPVEAPIIRQVVADWEAKTGHKVNVLTSPQSSSDALALFQQQLAAGTSDVDLYFIDSVWPGLIGDHLLDLKEYDPDGARIGDHIPSVVGAYTVRGRVVGLPLMLDAGMVYYRTDLLEKYNKPVPETWQELTDTAAFIQDAERKAGNSNIWGFVFQGRAYEGLTCNALEWLASHGGGTIVDADGKITVNNPNAVQALREAASWMGTITPDGVLNYAEEESRGVFQSGNAVFMRNWPYVWALAQQEASPVQGKIGIFPVPKGGIGEKSTGALGGWGMAVSRYSKNIDVATDLLFYITGREGQKKFSILGTYTPSIVELFDDGDIKQANPVAIIDLFMNAVPRPSAVTGSKYNRVSSEFYNAVHQVLSKGATPEDALKTLEANLRRVGRGGWK